MYAMTLNHIYEIIKSSLSEASQNVQHIELEVKADFVISYKIYCHLSYSEFSMITQKGLEKSSNSI